MTCNVMTPFGWAFMVIAWTMIIGISFYCFFKLLARDKKTDPEE
jgi:hypothetical protein